MPITRQWCQTMLCKVTWLVHGNNVALYKADCISNTLYFLRIKPRYWSPRSYQLLPYQRNSLWTLYFHFKTTVVHNVSYRGVRKPTKLQSQTIMPSWRLDYFEYNLLLMFYDIRNIIFSVSLICLPLAVQMVYNRRQHTNIHIILGMQKCKSVITMTHVFQKKKENRVVIFSFQPPNVDLWLLKELCVRTLNTIVLEWFCWGNVVVSFKSTMLSSGEWGVGGYPQVRRIYVWLDEVACS